MPSSLFRFALLLLPLLLLAACDSADDPGDPMGDPPPGREIVVFDQATSAAVLGVEPGRLELAASDGTRALQPGDILVAVPSERAPDGFLRRVVSVSESGGRVTVNTTAASLSDVLEDETVSVADAFTLADVDTVEALGGGVFTLETTGAQQTGASDLVFDTNLALGLSTSGRLSVNIQPIFDLRYSGYRLLHLEAGASVDAEASVTVQATVEVEGDYGRPIGRITFKPRVHFVGPIPIVYRPVLTVGLGVRGRLGGGVEMTPRATFLAAERLIWDRAGGWDHDPALNGGFTFDTTPIATAAVEAYVQTRLDLVFFDVAGPYVAPEVNVGLSIEENQNTGCLSWEADGALALGSGLDGFQLFDIDLPGIAFPSIDFLTVGLGEGASDCPPVVTSVTFPPTVPNTPQHSTPGTIRFEDLDGDLNGVCLDLVSGPGFGGCFDVPGLEGVTTGTIAFSWTCLASTPCQTGTLVYDVILSDAEGHESAPYRFSFEVVGVDPAAAGFPGGMTAAAFRR